MKLYLDEDMASALLVKLLQQAGHNVNTPVQAGMLGQDDPLQHVQSIRENRSILSYNYVDFEHLHLLIMESRGHHPGKLVVRRDDDPRKNMPPRNTVQALGNLESAGFL